MSKPRGTSVDSSVALRAVGTDRRSAPSNPQGFSTTRKAEAGQVLGVACVPECELPGILNWARSRQVPSLVCFTAIDVVRLFHSKTVRLAVLGSPPDARLSETLRALRRLDAQVPILHLPANTVDPRQIAGPVPGADFRLVAPYSQLEVAGALDRFWSASNDTTGVLEAGPICLRLGSRSLTVDDVPVPLKGKRLDLVAYLLRSPNRVISQEELALSVIGSVRGDRRRISKEMSAIRAALGSAAAMIETCSGGYRMNTPSIR